MKITDFEIGKKYRLSHWYRSIFYKFDEEGILVDERGCNVHLTFEALRIDDWIEVEEEEKECNCDNKYKDIQNLLSMLEENNELLQFLIEDGDKEILDLKNQICELKNQLYESRSKENELSNLACKFREKIKELESQLVSHQNHAMMAGNRIEDYEERFRKCWSDKSVLMGQIEEAKNHLQELHFYKQHAQHWRRAYEYEAELHVKKCSELKTTAIELKDAIELLNQCMRLADKISQSDIMSMIPASVIMTRIDNFLNKTKD